MKPDLGDHSVPIRLCTLSPSIRERVLLNVLRTLGIPDALGLLAPVPLTFVHVRAAVFDRTAEIYRLAGAAKYLKRK